MARRAVILALPSREYMTAVWAPVLFGVVDYSLPAREIFAALAEFERELITERSRPGLASARARGRVGAAEIEDASPKGATCHGWHGQLGDEYLQAM